jgi:hypothetical protein
VSVDEPDVIPSPVDPDVECVRAGDLAEPPGPDLRPSGEPLCPPGYVPRRKRREPYESHGKTIDTGRPAERNPDPREDGGAPQP